MLLVSHRQRIDPYLKEAWRRLRRQAAVVRSRFFRSAVRVPDRLIVAPTDLQPVDPFVAEEIMEGRFPLAGRILTVLDESIFHVELPTQAFAARLHAFSWLRHFRALKTPASAARARSIVDQWIGLHGRVMSGIAWDADIAAERLISWLCHSPVVLQGSDAGFYHRYVRSLALQVRYLNRVAATAPDGEIRFKLRIALAMASVSMPVKPTVLRRAGRLLDREIERQILPDGGHVSRNPRMMLELLLYLLPLRQTYVNLGHDLPSRLIAGIDRIYPALRFFRHQDGNLALFNGATSTLANELMSVLRYDETGGQPFRALPHMNYQRMAANGTLLIVDTGPPLTLELSRTAHAGCLSFEMSSGRNRFIVNSGAPKFAIRTTRQLARSTAAHSTVTVNETSSARLSASKLLGPVMVSGVSRVLVERHDDADGSDCLQARHDGYLAPFGLVHQRSLRLAADGGRIYGEDRLLLEKTVSVPLSAVARFHVHPSIDLTPSGTDAVLLKAPDGETWLFSAPGENVVISEDIFFADSSGIRRAEQIEIAFSPGETDAIRWQLVRHK